MKNKTLKTLSAKLLRLLRITKPIALTEQEVLWIKLCKLHLKDKYPMQNSWIDTIKPLFEEIYGWSPEEHPADFRDCMFQKLLDLYLKIQDDQSGCNAQLKEVFKESFSKWRRDYEQPVERAIAELCGQIQNTRYLKDGVPRYLLTTSLIIKRI